MKEVLLGILAILLLHATSGDSTADQRRYKALQFGQTHYDYIMYQPDMQPFGTAFTVCAWIRKLGSAPYPTWFSYAVRSQAKHIQITDMGGRFYMFGDISDLRSLYTVSPGTWFHNCLGWDSATQTRNVYINGVLVDSKATSAGSTLGQDGYLLIGNEQDGYGTGMDGGETFGGEMYKLNVFSKKLSDAEIQEMATERCSGVEETYGEVRSIRWEDILLKTRNGDVTEIGSGCEPAILIGKLRDKLQLTEDKLNGTLEELERTKQEKETYRSNLESKGHQLNTTELELTQTEERMGTCQKDFESKAKQLNETVVELERTKGEKNTCRANLENKGQQLNATEAQKQATIEELNKTSTELNSTTTALNQTQAELEHVKELLEKAANATPDCALNSTVTSHWDLLYSEEFFGGIVTTEKLEVLRKSMKKLEYFEGIRITDGVIRFFKLFHDGEDQCPN